MTEEEFEEIRDKDHVVLQNIKEGLDDVQKITAETTLENHHVSYCFEKLENLGLITVEKPDRMVERVIDGQKRVFQHPKQAKLTKKGERCLEHLDNDLHTYEDMSHSEIVNEVHNLKGDINDIRKSFEIFRKQVQERLQD